MSIRIPKSGRRTGFYYVIQSTQTHETKVWGDPNSKFVKSKPDPFYEWGEMTRTYVLGVEKKIDVHRCFQDHGPSQGLMTIMAAEKLLHACREADKESYFDKPFGNERLMRRTRHIFRIAKITYDVTTEVIAA